jgi:hypothetical protein
MDGRWSSFLHVWYAFDRVRAGSVVLPRQQLLYIVQASPSLKEYTFTARVFLRVIDPDRPRLTGLEVE